MELRALGIKVARGGRLALTAPDFAVAAGQAAVLTGPNGAGKSTLLRALAGLLPLSAGDAVLDGAHLAKDREAFQDRVAYAGHLDAVKPALTVRENLAFWAGVYGAAHARADEGLEVFGLTHIADAPAAYCSAGQKRRLGLARLCCMDRPLWLLDEPTVSLDAASTRVFADLVARHVAGGGLALVATHVGLGLPDGPEIAVAPPAIAAADGADPFLEGW